jgi:hypothetical protein
MTKDEAFLEWYNNAHWGNEDLKECCHRSWNAAIKQARSAPVQEPVAYRSRLASGSYTYCNTPQFFDNAEPLYTTPPPAPVQEPVAAQCRFPAVAWAQCDVEHARMVMANPHEWKGYEVRLLYTTPPAAQRQWVGLTDDEFENIELGCRSTPFGKIEAMRKVEAKLKEKNGLHRQHVIDGSPCWCEPETSYTDPETGASVVVHKEPQ